MPKWGLTMEEAVVASIHTAVGQRVEVGDVLMELDADKVTGEVESPVAGTVREIVVQVESVVLVEGLLMILEED